MKRKTMKNNYRKNRTKKLGGTLPDKNEYTESEVNYIQSSLVQCNLNVQEVMDSMRLISTFKHFIQGDYLIDIFTKIKYKPSTQRHDLVYTFLDRIGKIIQQLVQVLEDEQIKVDMSFNKEKYENAYNDVVTNQDVKSSVGNLVNNAGLATTGIADAATTGVATTGVVTTDVATTGLANSTDLVNTGLANSKDLVNTGLANTDLVTTGLSTMANLSNYSSIMDTMYNLSTQLISLISI